MNKNSCTTPELLYFGYGDTASNGMHSHDFYQIEFCIEGNIPAITDREKITLRQGELWLIPPGLRHRFLKSEEKYRYITLKFTCDENIHGFKGTDDICCTLLKSILAVIKHECGLDPNSASSKFVIETMLSGILSRLALHHQAKQGEPYICSAIKELVSRYGYQVNIPFAAEKLSLTRSQLHYRFAKFSNGSTDIKAFIEDALLNLAEKHLRYSPMNISEIASELNFSSIYSFSRFYKRKTGISPMEMRKIEREENQ